MKRVDQIIKYLSGELSPEESLAFERELKENPRLQEEFSDVELAYRTIDEQLKSEDEKVFSDALLMAMNHSKTKRSVTENAKLKSPRLRLRFLFMAAAASVVLLVSIFISQGRSDKLYTAWYNPSGDPVILTLEANMRGEAGHQAVAELWKKKDYTQCRIEAGRILSDDETDHFALLFLLLASMETGDQTSTLNKIHDIETDPDQTLGQAITWYTALALLKEGESQEALALLGSLEVLSGPYQRDAHKLKKKLKK